LRAKVDCNEHALCEAGVDGADRCVRMLVHRRPRPELIATTGVTNMHDEHDVAWPRHCCRSGVGARWWLCRRLRLGPRRPRPAKRKGRGSGRPHRTVGGAVVAGLPFWTSAIYGYYEVSSCSDAQQPTSDETRHAERDAEAAALTEKATAAARSGDCATARIIGTQVLELDSQYYDTQFVSGAIRSCLEQDADACSRRRHDIFARANAISDPQQRAHLLETAPVCRALPIPVEAAPANSVDAGIDGVQ
jgi:hypothetical protein